MNLETKVCDHLNWSQFEIAVRRLADSLSYGTDSSPFVGAGVDYVQSRPFVDGDPTRSIDWRATARTRRLHVKEYEAPKRMPVIIALDTSGSMCVKSGKVSKYAWGVQLAGGLALAALARVSPVGLIGCGSRALRHEPSLKSSQIFQWLKELRTYHFGEKTRVGERIRQLSGLLTTRSLVIVLSDLHDKDAVPALKLLAQRHDCVVLQLQDPSELGLPGAGFFRAKEAETDKHFSGWGKSQWALTPDASRSLARAGVDHLVLQTDEPIVHKLRNFMKRRGNFWQGTR